jgi:hypothetical protein
MMQIQFRILNKAGKLLLLNHLLLNNFPNLKYFRSLMVTNNVTFSVQVLDTYLQRTSCMQPYRLHSHTKYRQMLSISVTKTTTKYVTYTLLTTYLLKLINNVTTNNIQL